MRLKKYRLDVLNVGNSVFKANVFFFTINSKSFTFTL